MDDFKLDIFLPLLRGNSPVDEGNSTAQQFLQNINSRTHAIVFSPHLDDAVLSTASLVSYLVEKNVKITFVTLFTEGKHIESISVAKILKRSKFTHSEAYFKERRAEDIKAIKILGVTDIQQLGYIDAAWRTGESGQALYPSMQVGEEIVEQDKKFHTEIVKNLQNSFAADQNTLVFAPLARGRHVDHVLTRNAVAAVFPQTVFYEDFPYSVLFENEHDFIKEKGLTLVEWGGDFEKKKDAILAYGTQHASLSLFGKGKMELTFEKYYAPIAK